MSVLRPGMDWLGLRLNIDCAEKKMYENRKRSIENMLLGGKFFKEILFLRA